MKELTMSKQQEAMQLALRALESMKETLAEHDEPTTFNEDQAITAIKEALAQPEQEPVAWMDEDGDVLSASIVDGKGLRNIPLYTTPPQRQPLTDEEITEIYTKWESTKGTSWADLIRAIEAAHGIGEKT